MSGPASSAVAAAGQTVGPGTVLMRVRQMGPSGPVEAFVLRVNLGDPAVQPGLLYPGVISAARTLSAMAERTGAFAAINGDFFNIGASGAPVGPVVAGGRLLKAPQPGRALAVGIGVDGVGRISTVRLRGSVGLPRGPVVLSDLNDANPGYAPMLTPNGVGLFTSSWGSYTRAGAARGLESVTEALIRGGRVAGIRHQAGSGAIAAGSYVLLGAGRGGRALARLRIGEAVSVDYGQTTPAPARFRFAIGAKYRLLRAGAVQGGLPVAAGAERTAVGFSHDGRVMYLVVTEGREVGVPGLDLPQLAGFMRGLGVRDAVNLDDGGSTTIVVRLPGRGGVSLLNHPADGTERNVANGIGLRALNPTRGRTMVEPRPEG
ncbi:MAG TPA: phosphodiester glycosidase family protein [Solirubrobacteraceae bacterium]|nr:phosphodiester glycosidase family protein [Solirubrobacteraceae bacterium]